MCTVAFDRRSIAAILFAAMAAVAASGCGYRLQTAAGSRSSDASVRMDVSPFTNASTIPDAGSFVAARLREELRRGGYRGGFERRGADFLVDGKVQESRESVVSHSVDSRFGLEYRLTIVLDIRVVEVASGRVVWKESGITETAPFYSGPDPQYTEANRRAAFEDAVRRLAIRLAQTIRVVV
ncbi:MAG TPA: LPS assembly lipoprotein LptE [Candidatus Deferrimicrobiaceae bacterium]